MWEASTSLTRILGSKSDNYIYDLTMIPREITIVYKVWSNTLSWKVIDDRVTEHLRPLLWLSASLQSSTTTTFNKLVLFSHQAEKTNWGLSCPDDSRTSSLASVCTYPPHYVPSHTTHYVGWQGLCLWTQHNSATNTANTRTVIVWQNSHEVQNGRVKWNRHSLSLPTCNPPLM
jgi:hypothetical protein